MNHPRDPWTAFAGVPPPLPGDLRPQLRAALRARAGHKLVVLDDDPTGTQTVHDVPVLTTWEVGALRREFESPGDCFYVLTNSRSLAPVCAAQRAREIARHLAAAAPRERWTLVSRSDSTLRGHFPLETDILAATLGPFDATFLVPYFEAGGRYTVDDTHYVLEDGRLLPAGETPFARDAAFGYRSSNLREWVEEKTAGRVKAAQVVSFSLPELRAAPPAGGEDALLRKLLALPAGTVAIVNACHPSDLHRFILAVRVAERAGRRFLFRTAAEFVAAWLALEPRAPWRPAADRPWSAGGLTVVGSYVPKTTAQLTRLIEAAASAGGDGPDIVPIELPVSELLSARCDALVQATAARVDRVVSSGHEAVVFTSRGLVTGDSPESSLAIGSRVSAALVAVVRRLGVAPRHLVAKGGVTSSDLATMALGVQRAMVRGQIVPGVPVWELGSEARFPGLPYVVFPGNVGGPEALLEVLRQLSAGAPRPGREERERLLSP